VSTPEATFLAQRASALRTAAEWVEDPALPVRAKRFERRRGTLFGFDQGYNPGNSACALGAAYYALHGCATYYGTHTAIHDLVGDDARAKGELEACYQNFDAALSPNSKIPEKRLRWCAANLRRAAQRLERKLAQIEAAGRSKRR